MAITIDTLLESMAALEKEGRHIPDEVKVTPEVFDRLVSSARPWVEFDTLTYGYRFAGLRVVRDASVAGAEFYRQGKRLTIP